MDASQKIHDATGKYGFMAYNGDQLGYWCFVYQAGGHILTANRTQVCYTNPGSVKGMEFYVNMQKEDWCPDQAFFAKPSPGTAFFSEMGAMYLEGNDRHLMERCLDRGSLRSGVQSVGSTRGASSHQHNPFVILCDRNAGEDSGLCYGAMLVYSGNFEAARVCSPSGFRGMSRQFHRAIREHLIRGPYKGKRRPVLINNWGATYFDFTADKLMEIAREASALGIELFGMDDGWFGMRNDDDSGLGDWFVNEKKLPGGLEALVPKINGLGISFGIWVEPEMVNEDSELYRAHPDWALWVPGRAPARGRGQLVLDFSRLPFPLPQGAGPNPAIPDQRRN